MSGNSDMQSVKARQNGTISVRKAAFCREFVKDYNATQAYLRAGYSKNGAKQGAARLLTKVDVKEEVAKLERELREQNALTREWVIAKLQENVARAAQEYPVLDNKGKPTGEYRYEANAVNRGLELLGKAINMFEAHQQAGAPKIQSMSNAELAIRLEKAAKTLKQSGNGEKP